jgi:hypothetical protein
VPVTLATVRGEVAAFAQDGVRIAWIDGEDGCDSRIRLRTLATGSQRTLGNAGRWGENQCLEMYLLPTVPFALAGTRVAWGGFDTCCNSGYGGVATVAPGEKPRTLESLVWAERWSGDYLTGVAGDRATLLYSTVIVTQTPDSPDECFNGPCVFTVTKGAVKRVIGRSISALPGLPPSAAIAVSGSRVALVPAALGPFRCTKRCDGFFGGPTARPNGPVEIHDASTGELVAQFSPAGTVQAVALSDKIAVVLVRTGRNKRIERYDAQTGKLIGATSVPATTADTLAAAGTRIVFQTGRKISLLDSTTSKASLLTTAGSTPIGLSIEGRRVAWAENGSKTQARVRAITLPR